MKSITAQSVRDNILLKSWVQLAAWACLKELSACWSTQTNSVYDSTHWESDEETVSVLVILDKHCNWEIKKLSAWWSPQTNSVHDNTDWELDKETVSMMVTPDRIYDSTHWEVSKKLSACWSPKNKVHITAPTGSQV